MYKAGLQARKYHSKTLYMQKEYTASQNQQTGKLTEKDFVLLILQIYRHDRYEKLNNTNNKVLSSLLILENLNILSRAGKIFTKSASGL
jgi:hypothetical protein